jgi:beta-glucosidase
VSAAEAGAAVTPSRPEDDAVHELAARFPPGFLWGASTSAYQIEGSVDVDGRVPSIWDRFAHTPGATLGGATGDAACDHYRRWREDLDLMARLGLRAYRFGIAWPRVIADDRVNPAGLAFYRRLVEGLLERDIVPMVTLYHWDLPLALHDAGGWTNRDTAERFAEYAGIVAHELGDVVPLWLTQNEPWVHAFVGYGQGIHAPGERDWPRAFAVAHELLRAHGLAAQAVRAAAGRDVRVGLATDLYPIEPATDRPEDVAAAERMDGWRNRWILDPVLRGSYPCETLEEVERRYGRATWIREGDLETIAQPIDLLGVNFYWRTRVRAGGGDDVLGVHPVTPDPPLTAMGWEVVPDRLESVLLRLRRDYGDVPIYVTENGAAYDDGVGPDGRIDDPLRVDFLRRHVDAVAAACEAGVDVRGYFVWSLMDNFEWHLGYSVRFGLVHVDFDTQVRTPKASASWYRALIAAGPLSPRTPRPSSPAPRARPAP